MKTTLLRRVTFGAAKALTRDGIGVQYTEVRLFDSEYPPAG